MAKVRTVLAGCGGICGAWMKDAVKKRVDLVGFVDIRQEAAEKRREDFGYPNAVVGTNLAKVLKETKPEVVFDCSVPEAHHSITLTALKHGCHVMGEKPLADSMPHARQMVAAAKKARKIYSVIQNRRYAPNIRSLQRFLESDKIGKVTTVQSNFFIGAHFGGFRDVMKHVLLLDMSIHTFDMARLITGADARKVYCHEFNPSGSWYKHGASAVAIFEMTGGLVYTYQGSWCAEGCNTTWECDWHIIGEKGSATWDGGQNFRVQQVKKTGGFFSEMRDLKIPIRAPKRKVGSHSGVILEFLDCVQKGGTPETVASDNIKSLAMVFGAIESAKKGKRVAVKA